MNICRLVSIAEQMPALVFKAHDLQLLHARLKRAVLLLLLLLFRQKTFSGELLFSSEKKGVSRSCHFFLHTSHAHSALSTSVFYVPLCLSVCHSVYMPFLSFFLSVCLLLLCLSACLSFRLTVFYYCVWLTFLSVCPLPFSPILNMYFLFFLSLISF
jgi:hypothetical protein